MVKGAEKTTAIIIPDAREKIESAILGFIADKPFLDKKEIFKAGISSLDLTEEQLKETASDSTHTRYKALTGTIIRELEQKGSIKYAESESPGAADEKQKKDIVREYLYSKFLTDEEKKDKRPDSKGNKIKSILGNEKNKALIRTATIEEIQDSIEKQFKKIAGIADTVENYPTTPIGNCLRNNKEQFDKFIKKEMDEAEYLESLNASIIKAITESGSANFTRLGLDLIKEVYKAQAFKITHNAVTDGGQDRGIDAELIIENELGFAEKIVIQTKTRQKETANIGEKITREFLGSMAFAEADKGIIIANTAIHKDAKDIAKKFKNLVFIDKKKLAELMKKHRIGIIEENKGLLLDKKMFIIE